MEIGSLIEKFKKVADLSEAKDVLSSIIEISECRLESGLYFYKGHFIRFSLTQDAKQQVEKLQFANKLELSCAPKFIDVIYLDTEEAIIISKATDDEALKNPLKVEVGQNLDQGSKEKLLFDIDLLLGVKCLHPVLISSPSDWYYLKDQNRIVLEIWWPLRSFSGEEYESEVRMMFVKTAGKVFATSL